MAEHLSGTEPLNHFASTDSLRVPKEILAASIASLLVSPLVAIIDKSLVKEITGYKQFATAMGEAAIRMFTQPRYFFGGAPFLFTLAVYQVTYVAANLSEAALDYARVEPSESRKATKVGLAATANVGMLAWRDAMFAKMYTTNKTKAPVPLKTIGLFATRDAATMWATFYLAPAAALYLQRKYNVDKNTAEVGCSLALPVGMQVLTAPLHVHAFDIYQRPDITGAGQVSRFGKVREEMGKVCFARCLRILPAFGIGSLTNSRLREWLILHPDQQRVSANQFVPSVGTTAAALYRPR
jgi:hypothetical protein